MKNMKWLFDTPIAHRGLHGGEIAENSMSAFGLAIEKGFNIEIDVHLSKDGEVVVFHDLELDRICGVKGNIIDYNLDELKKYKLSKTQDTIPTLKELLKLIDGKVGLLIEIKYRFNKIYRNICKEVYKIIKDYNGAVAIQSFSPKVVKWFKINAPEVTRGLLASAYDNMNFSNTVRKSMRAINRLIGPHFVKSTSPDFIAYNVLSFPSPTMKKYRESGMPFLTWTVRTNEQLTIAKEWADNIIFENLKILNF